MEGSWTTKGMPEFNRDGWRMILYAAEKRNDEKLPIHIRDQDLFACEAKYHKSCETKYLQCPTKWSSQSEEDKARQEAIEHSHKIVFNEMCQKMDQEVLCEYALLKLSDLCGLYKSALEKLKQVLTLYVY